MGFDIWGQIAQQVGIPLAAVMLTVYVFNREMIVTGSAFKRELAAREKAEKEAEEWKEMAIRGTYTAERATTVAELSNNVRLPRPRRRSGSGDSKR